MNPSETFTIEIASVPDRDAVVAEIWLADRLLAELRDEAGQHRLQLYPSPSGGAWDLEPRQFLAALENARLRLERAHRGDP